MEMIRMVQAEEELLECTFRPSLASSAPSSKVSTRATTPVAVAAAREDVRDVPQSSNKPKSEHNSYTKAHIIRTVCRKEPSPQLNIEKRIQSRQPQQRSAASHSTATLAHTPKPGKTASSAITFDIASNTPGPRQALQFNTPLVRSGQSSRALDDEVPLSARVKEDAVRALKEAKAALDQSLPGRTKATLSAAVAAAPAPQRGKSGFSIDNPRTWSAVDVRIWLEAVGAKQAVPPFTLHGVDGPRLLSLCSDGHLKALSVVNDQLR
jgi:hypothetical protein